MNISREDLIRLLTELTELTHKNELVWQYDNEWGGHRIGHLSDKVSGKGLYSTTYKGVKIRVRVYDYFLFFPCESDILIVEGCRVIEYFFKGVIQQIKKLWSCLTQQAWEIRHKEEEELRKKAQTGLGKLLDPS